ncbi:MAG: protein kinase [Polyangiaceae bacterium]|nr:protein kinase [Polyangiaceae bacterium]
MSSIRVALDERLGRRVAMKQVDLPLEPGSKEARRFLDEAQITGQLDHPNIVPIHELGLDPRGAPTFFTMKLVRGRDLGARLDELGPARLEADELEALVRVLVRVCDAVSFAHSLGVIHRDLKPRNVMIGAFGQVYVMDWGLALVRAKSEHPPEERSHAIGTPAYMAPEQAWPRFEAIDERTDVYGLGGILYTVLTGTAPHGVLGDPIATVLAAREGVVRPPEELAPQDRLPPELCRIAMKALAPDPRDRYQAVPELELELEAFLRGGGWLATRVYEPGAVIVREGDEAEEAFIVTGGACEVVRTTRGRSHVVGRMGVGEVFGETMLLEGQRRQATVRAVDRVTVKVVTREAMRRELAGRSFLGSFLAVLADRFRETATELEALRRVT